MLRQAIDRIPGRKELLRRLRDRFLPAASVSSNYVEINPDEMDAETVRLRAAWQSEALPLRQRELVDRQLAAYGRGEPVDVFDVLVRALSELPNLRPGASLLEVG